MDLKNKIKVSVIVPVYNTSEGLLKRCFDSLNEQDIDSLEVIIVDDGSAETTADFCKDYVKNHSGFYYFRQKNKGVSCARNYGITQSRGNYITFVDSDDWLEKNALNLCYKRAFSSGADIVVFDTFINYENRCIENQVIRKDVNSGFNNEDIQKKILYNKSAGLNVYGIVFGKLYKSNLVKQNRVLFPEEISMSEDQIFSLYAFQYANKVEVIDENLYHYYVHNASVCNTYNENFAYIKLTNLVYEELMLFYSRFDKNEFFKSFIYLKLFKLITVVLTKHIFNFQAHGKMSNKIELFRDYLKHENVKEVIDCVTFSLLNKRELVMYMLIKFHLYYCLGFAIQYKQKHNSLS